MSANRAGRPAACCATRRLSWGLVACAAACAGPVTPAPGGLYLGTSASADGQRAWLIRFADAMRSGRLYAPPDNPALTPVSGRAPAGGVALRSAPGLGDVYYVLVARSTTDGIVGTIETLRARRHGADTVLARADVRLRAVAAREGALAGVYSNVAIHDESGDANGAELVLLEAQPGRWAAVTTADDGDLVPRAATEVTGAGTGMRFTWRSPDGPKSYAAAAAGRALVVRSTGGEVDTLVRRARLTEFLGGAAGH